MKEEIHRIGKTPCGNEPSKGMDATLVPLLTVKEVAKILKIDPKSVRAEINAGRLCATRIGTKGGVTRIRSEWLDAYLEKRKIFAEVELLLPPSSLYFP